MRELHRHLDAEETERYLMGTSSDSETADLEEHLLVCARCRARVSDTDVYLFSMSEAARESREQGNADTGGRWRLSRLLPAVVVAGGLLLLGYLALR